MTDNRARSAWIEHLIEEQEDRRDYRGPRDPERRDRDRQAGDRYEQDHWGRSA